MQRKVCTLYILWFSKYHTFVYQQANEIIEEIHSTISLSDFDPEVSMFFLLSSMFFKLV